MASEDDAIAKVAVDLNEESKAKRRKRGGTEALDAGKAHLGGDSGPALAPGERWHEGELLAGFSFDAEGYVVDVDGERTGARRVPDEGTMADAVASLGDAVDRHAPDEEPVDLSEGAHTLAVDRMRNLASDAAIVDRSLIAFGRDFMLEQIKSRPKPWSATSNAEQRDVAAACEHASQEYLRKVLEFLAAHGRGEPVRVLLGKVTMGDDIVISGKVKTTDAEEERAAVLMLHGAHGKHVMLTVASIDDYRGGNDAETMPDQPGFGFEAGADAHPADDSDLAGDDDD